MHDEETTGVEFGSYTLFWSRYLPTSWMIDIDIGIVCRVLLAINCDNHDADCCALASVPVPTPFLVR
jgi:hypothetical protein